MKFREWLKEKKYEEYKDNLVPTIYDFIMKNINDKEQILKMQRKLSEEIKKGILKDDKHKKELELLNKIIKDKKY